MSFTMDYTTIVNADVVYAHCEDPDWRIVDCHYNLQSHDEGYALYCQRHLPNAVYAHLKNDLAGTLTPTSGRHPLPDAEQLIQTVQRLGIDNNTQVVTYDNANGSYAARLWWLLRWLGHGKVAVLNGGFQQWQQLGLPVTNKIPNIPAGNFKGNPDMSMLVDTNDIETKVPNAQLTLVDVRDPERFQGIKEPIDRVAGHIPHAVNVPWKTNLDSQGLFQSPQQLHILYQQCLHSSAPEQIVFMCGSGVTACHSVLALTHAGIQGTKLYAGSWSEWITNPAHPVQTGIE